MLESFRCPHCGSVASVVEATAVDTYHPGYHVAGRPLPTKRRPTTVIACSGCEMVVDLHHSSGQLKTVHQVFLEVEFFGAQSTQLQKES